MTQERARFLFDNYVMCEGLAFSYSPAPFKNSPIRDWGITLSEDGFIRMVWSMMGQDKSYYDALAQIAGTG